MKLFDSSPLIAVLGNLNNKDLLKYFIKLGYELFVPMGVTLEVSGNPEKENLTEMTKNGEIKVLEAPHSEEVNKFRNRYFKLGKGESELIILGIKWKEENKTFCCIIDDKEARKIAERLGLKCKGTIGLLTKLKNEKVVQEDSFKESLKILEEAGFRYKFK